MKYFTVDELTRSVTAEHHGIANIPGKEVVKNLDNLVHCVLDPLREAWGGAILVTSGYRCDELNRLVGGVAGSYHRLGMAADIRPENGYLDALYRLIRRLFEKNRIGITECYINHDKGYIHIAYDISEFNAWPFLN